MENSKKDQEWLDNEYPEELKKEIELLDNLINYGENNRHSIPFDEEDIQETD